MAQRYASYLSAEGIGSTFRPYLYAQSVNAVSLGSYHRRLDFVCFIYFGVEALEEKEMNAAILQVVLLWM